MVQSSKPVFTGKFPVIKRQERGNGDGGGWRGWRGREEKVRGECNKKALYTGVKLPQNKLNKQKHLLFESAHISLLTSQDTGVVSEHILSSSVRLKRFYG